ncbi:MAG: hypothetical protein M3R25_06925 [Bacteroidota bacterium]|nr:hypothetical protein [Bacteroidota bacterium]
MKIKIQSIPFIAFSMLMLGLLTSCGDLNQNLYLKSDGSGTLETTFDVGELMSMAKGFGGMAMDMDSVTDDNIVDTFQTTPAAPKDAMTLFMEKITDPAHDQDVDTLISFADIMPDSIRQKDTRPDLTRKMAIRLISPANSGNLTIGMVMNFVNTTELREMVSYMKNIDQQPELMPGSPMGIETDNFLVFDADMKAGWIRVDTILYTDLAAQMDMGMGMGMSGDSTMSSEDMGMMEMMFGNSKLKTVIHVPGEVMSCTNSMAILTKDNKVIVEQPFMDVIKNGKFNGFTIHFKP